MSAEEKVCALIPAFNEADVIASVVRETQKYIKCVFVIDDGSDDGTGEIAKDSGASCIRLDQNGGKGAALRKGISCIKDREFDYVVLLDGDGQHRSSDIPALIRAARQQNADMVIGTRSFDRNRMPRERFFSNSVGSKVASLLLGQEIRDSQSGFRLIRMDKLRNLRLRAKKYEIEMEILIKMSLAGCRIVQAPVYTIYDNDKAHSKMHPVRDTIRICIWSLFYRFIGL
jgi:glycosyltransferase involved in cell wall biosynthesis